MRGLLAGQSRSRIEKSYMTEGEAIVLNDIPCEMKYRSEQAFIEHESEKHNYLPVFHFRGKVLEISGDFPFNVSSIYFSEMDSNQIPSDILYYPRPEELSHMIQTGRFYTDQFEIPEILSKNDYSFPVRVNLTVIPPYNVAAYEAATYEGAAVKDWEMLGIDKDNLPVFYVEFTGTGISRKNDQLLDYYGIDLEEDYPIFVLTADSSGYVNPPIVNYIPEPVPEEVEVEEQEGYYITKEDEMDMLRNAQAEAEKQNEQMKAIDNILNDNPVYDPEVALVADAYNKVENRVFAAREKQAQADGIGKNLFRKELEQTKERVAEKQAEDQKIVQQQTSVQKSDMSVSKQKGVESFSMEQLFEDGDMMGPVRDEEDTDVLKKDEFVTEELSAASVADKPKRDVSAILEKARETAKAALDKKKEDRQRNETSVSVFFEDGAAEKPAAKESSMAGVFGDVINAAVQRAEKTKQDGKTIDSLLSGMNENKGMTRHDAEEKEFQKREDAVEAQKAAVKKAAEEEAAAAVVKKQDKPVRTEDVIRNLKEQQRKLDKFGEAVTAEPEVSVDHEKTQSSRQTDGLTEHDAKERDFQKREDALEAQKKASENGDKKSNRITFTRKTKGSAESEPEPENDGESMFVD